MTVRRAIVGDEELLATLNDFVQAIHLRDRPDHFRQTQLPALAAWYKDVLQKPSTRAWIADDQGAAVGYVLAVVHHLPETPFTRPKDWLEIDQIAVDPNHRKRGVGRALVTKAIAEARAEGIGKVEAAAWCFNGDAQEMFRRLGFTPKAVRFELDERG
jgi:ribosomal protein S18 acetylase RimI-like enzyme